MMAYHTNRLRAVFLLYLVATCCITGVWAQTDQVNFTSLTSKDGLSSNIVNAILKDRFGWMWFATEDGLNRFDGNKFTIYRHKANDSSSLPVNDVTSLFEDKAGNLWVGTNGGFLSLYDRKKDAFTDVLSNFSGKIFNNVVKSICSDHQGNIWVAGFGGLYIVDPVAKKITRQPIAIVNGKHTLTDSLILSVYEDSRHRLWIGANSGLFLFDRNKHVFYPFRHSDEDTGSLVNNAVKAIAEDKKGNIWIGTGGGVSLLAPGAGRFRNFTHSNANDKTITNDLIHTIATGNEDKLWLGTEDGISIMDTKTGECATIRPDARNTYSLNRKTVRAMYVDDQDIYWVGTYQGGINKYNKSLNLFQLKQSNPFDPKGLRASAVTSFAEGNNGNVFVGTDGGGLHLFDRKSGLFTHIPLVEKETTASGDLSILTLGKGNDGGLWIGTFATGLFYLDPATGRHKQFKRGTGSASLNSNDIFCIKKDKKGKLWIGTNGGGVNVYDPVSRIFHKYTNKPRDSADTRLPLNGYIRCIEEDAQGYFWIASHGTGIGMLDPVSNKCRVYDRGNSHLPSNSVLTVLEDHNGNIWAGTSGGGLSLLDKQSNQFISYSEKEGLANGIIYKIIEDEQGLLWVSTNTGISSFDVITKRFTNYTRYNGIQNNNFAMGSGIRMPDGEIFFGGLDGFNFFYPRNLKQNKNVPSLLLTDLKVANQSVLPSDNGPIKEHISITKEISLGYQQSFSLSYTALDYTSPEQNTYSYKLEGFDKTWIQAGASKTAYYTNIDPGDYVFRVRASNKAGVWSAKEISVIIHIKPPFWRTPYAYFFYVVSVIGLLLYSRHRTLNRLKRKFAVEQEKLLAAQALEQERKETEIARELDQLKIKFLTNLSHEFRTPISLIMGPVDNLLTKPNDEKTSGHLYMIKRNARRLLNLVNQLLDFRKMEEHELVLHVSQGEVIAFIKEVFDSFKDLSERKNIHYIFNTRVPRLFALFDHDKLERILFNLVSNAFKFTQAGGTIQLELEKADALSDEKTTWLTIRVSDTGIGIPEDKQEKIFERFFQNDTSATILNQGSGIGLSITKEFVTMHGGTITVQSRPDEGTVFVVQLPFAGLDYPEAALVERTQPAAGLPEAPADNETTVTVEDKKETATILLVEDNDDFRFYLKDNLKAFYKVVEAADGKEGWQKALAHHPHLIVSDINMPLMDGMQMSQKIRSDKRTSHIPIILLTALTGEDIQLKGLATGANDYMTKPFNFEILHVRIKNLLQQNRLLKDTFTKQIKILTPDVVIASESERFLQKVMLYIEDNLNDVNLSVEGLSRHMGMSRSSLYSKMLELTGQTPVEYIRSVKLDKAAVLLEKSDMNVAQVAYSTGFATPNYFAKAFKAKFNMLPSEYVSLKRKH